MRHAGCSKPRAWSWTASVTDEHADYLVTVVFLELTEDIQRRDPRGGRFGGAAKLSFRFPQKIVPRSQIFADWRTDLKTKFHFRQTWQNFIATAVHNLLS